MAEKKVSKFTAGVRALLDAYDARFGTVAEFKFKDVTLKDGTTVVRFPTDKIVKGDKPLVITTEGELPLTDSAPDVPYELEDGTTFTVVNGMVDLITEVEEEIEEIDPATGKPKVKTPPAKTPEQVAAEKLASDAKPKRVIKSQVEEHVFSIEMPEEIIQLDFSAALKPYNDKVAALEAKNKSLLEQFKAVKKINDEMAVTIELIADEPAKTPEEEKLLAQKKYEDMTPLEKYRFDKAN